MEKTEGITIDGNSPRVTKDGNTYKHFRNVSVLNISVTLDGNNCKRF